MTTTTPVRMQITLPRLSDNELCRLYRKIEKLGDNHFTRRLRLMIGGEVSRRESTEPKEPTMDPLAIAGGIELSQALSVVRTMDSWKVGSNTRAFLDEVTSHVYAMAQAALEMLDAEVRGLTTLRTNKETQFELLRPSEVAVMLGISEATLKRLVEAGSVPAPIRLGNRRYWRESVIDTFLKKQAQADNSVGEEDE